MDCVRKQSAIFLVLYEKTSYLCIVKKKQKLHSGAARITKKRITKYLSRTAQHTVPSKVKKGKKIMKKLINKWLKSEAYTEYCLNIARLYNYHAAM